MVGVHLLLGGCTPVIAGSASAASDQIIDVRVVDPCDGLTRDQARVLGAGEPIPAPASRVGERSCQWVRTAIDPLGAYYVEGNGYLDISDWAPYPPGSPPFHDRRI